MSVAATVAESTADGSDVRFVGVLSGCYTLSNKRDALTGALKVFACRTQSVSSDRLVLDGALFGAAGDRIALKLEELGLLHGEVERVMATGLVARLHLEPEDRVKVSAKLAWIKKRRFKRIVDKRASRRWFPRNPRTNILFADGEKLDAFIIDLSRSGVAISAEVKPAVGTPMAVGGVLGRVVRHLDGGFAVGFPAIHDEKLIEGELTTLMLGEPEERLANLKTYSAILSVVS